MAKTPKPSSHRETKTDSATESSGFPLWVHFLIPILAALALLLTYAH